MHESWHVVWELILLFASVLIFRSTWMFLDLSFGDQNVLELLIVGVLISLPALYILNRHIEKEYRPKFRLLRKIR